MLEFVFFHPVPTQEFVMWLEKRNIDVSSRQEDETFYIEISENINTSLYEEIEEEYAKLLEMNETLLIEEHQDDAGYHMAGIVVNLQDGGVSYADIDPKLLARVMESISPSEFSTIVDAIVTAVEKPQGRTFCQRQRDKENES